MFFHDYFHYLLAAFGAGLATTNPLAGTTIAAVALAYGNVRHLVGKYDSRKAEEAIANLKHVVNENARRLEALVLDVERLSAEASFNQNARSMGIR